MCAVVIVAVKWTVQPWFIS